MILVLGLTGVCVAAEDAPHEVAQSESPEELISQALTLVTNLLNRGQNAEAMELAEQTRDLARRALGEDHPYYTASLNNLAILYHNTGHHEDAEQLLLQAMAIRGRVLGEEHPDYAMSLNNLAFFWV